MKKNRRRTDLDEALKEDAEVMKDTLRRQGRDPSWLDEEYPEDWGCQVFILQGLLAA